MAKIINAEAFYRDEVAHVAWQTDGCLGLMAKQIHSNASERRVPPSSVPFKTQSNPHWEEHDASVWPIRRFAWRDLMLPCSRDEATPREGPLDVQYMIRPVRPMRTGLTPVPPSATAQPRKYTGKTSPLAFDDHAVQTDEVVATNGVLAGWSLPTHRECCAQVNFTWRTFERGATPRPGGLGE